MNNYESSITEYRTILSDYAYFTDEGHDAKVQKTIAERYQDICDTCADNGQNAGAIISYDTAIAE